MQSIIEGEIDLPTALTRMPASCRAFYDCPDRHAALAGGFRSAKTVTACARIITWAGWMPGSLWLVGRRTYPSLRDTTRRTFLELCPVDLVAEKGWVESKNELTFSNGSQILFRHLDITEADVRGHIRSLSLTGFLVDQAEEIDEGTYLTLQGRLSRRGTPSHFGRLVLNPAGHNWIWRRFYDPNRKWAWSAQNGFIASTEENRSNLPEGYIEDLLATYPVDWADRFIHGSFSDFTDLVYKEFSEPVHVYDANKEWAAFEGRTKPPDSWPVYVGVDIGGATPWAWIYAAVQPETGTLFVFDEIYRAGILVQELADLHNDIVKDRFFQGMAYDYENKQAALELEEVGVYGTPAIKDVMPGILKVGKYLKPIDTLVNPFHQGRPGARIYISSTCENLARELGSWTWAKNSVGELTGKPEEGGDHAADALRYLIHTFRPEPKPVQARPVWANPSIDEASRLYWRDVDRMKENVDTKRRRPRFAIGPLRVR